MLFRIGLEINTEGRSVGWALDLPGCFSYGADGSSAIVDMGRAIPAYIAWLDRHGQPPWFETRAIDIRLVDTWDVYCIDRATLQPAEDGIEVNAWFRDDWRPLDAEEIERALRLLAFSRADLLELARDTPPKWMNIKQPEERWSIAGILGHVANAEFWYMDRLGLAGMNRADLPADPLERLERTRARLIELLPAFAGSQQVVGAQGEFWSPRKVLRRAAWHERDHTGHIARLLASM